jgi:serine/threonine protein kinase
LVPTLIFTNTGCHE